MLDIINKIIWSVATVIIFLLGIYYSISLKFPQLKIKLFKNCFKKRKNCTITPFKILNMTLAGRIGVGSLAGIAIAIYYGGPGTIFWIWISSILTASLSFVESFLGVLYKEKDGKNYKGGPSFYIDKGLHKKKLAKIYAILIIASYFIGFLTIQANTISVSFNNMTGISKELIGILLAIITFIVIWKGLNSIANASSKIVPFMGVLYFILGIYILLKNYTKLPSIIYTIFKSAFCLKDMGIGFLTSFLIGIQRGIFSNEAGLGTGAIASGTCEDDNKIGQGMLQVVGVYFTSFIICTITAFIILTSDYYILNLENINGIEIIQYAFEYHLGSLGNIILFIIVFLFAFSTIITVYYYGESNLKYLSKKIGKKTTILKIVMVLLIIYGSLAKADILWNIVDIFVALLAIINLYSIYQLKDIVKNNYKE